MKNAFRIPGFYRAAFESMVESFMGVGREMLESFGRPQDAEGFLWGERHARLFGAEAGLAGYLIVEYKSTWGS